MTFTVQCDAIVPIGQAIRLYSDILGIYQLVWAEYEIDIH